MGKRTPTKTFLLSALKTLGEVSFDVLVGSFFPKKYAFTALGRKLLSMDPPSYVPQRRSISVLLSRFQQEGLVTKMGLRKSSLWRLTSRGKKILQALEGDERILPNADGVIRIVSFDVPEYERRKRDWLRINLRYCGYKMVQKSVWVGDRPLPDWFLKKAGTLNILDYLHIFDISNRGTLLV